MSIETSEDELFRLTIESQAINKRVITLMTEGTKIITKVEEEEKE